MKQTKIYKTRIGANLAILFAKVKNYFNGSHYVAETFTTKYNTDTKDYIIEHYTMTRDEEQVFQKAVAEQQSLIANLVLSQNIKQENKLKAVEKNRQNQLAKNKAKKSLPVVTDSPKMIATSKPKRQYNKIKLENKV